MKKAEYLDLMPIDQTRRRLESLAEVLGAMELRPFGEEATRLRGVVLWSNFDDGKAVIWGEDQGNLVYYLPSKDMVTIKAGDLVSFDLIIHSNSMRMAYNIARLEPAGDVAIFPQTASPTKPVDAPLPEGLRQAANFISAIAS